jgi:hypothetical protein
MLIEILSWMMHILKYACCWNPTLKWCLSWNLLIEILPWNLLIKILPEMMPILKFVYRNPTLKWCLSWNLLMEILPWNDAYPEICWLKSYPEMMLILKFADWNPTPKWCLSWNLLIEILPWNDAYPWNLQMMLILKFAYGNPTLKWCLSWNLLVEILPWKRLILKFTYENRILVFETLLKFAYRIQPWKNKRLLASKHRLFRRFVRDKTYAWTSRPREKHRHPTTRASCCGCWSSAGSCTSRTRARGWRMASSRARCRSCGAARATRPSGIGREPGGPKT